jgi:hypothetical protein
LKTVTIYHKSANEISEIIRELKLEHGMSPGQEFDFAYHPGRWDEMTGDVPKKTVFTFYNETFATWFALKTQ